MGNRTLFKKGSKVKVVANGGSHGLPIGTILTLKGFWPGGNEDYYEVEEHPTNTGNTKSFKLQDLIVVEDTVETITERLKQIEKERIELNHKLHWLQETGNIQFDETEFKIYQILEKIRASSVSNKLEKMEIVKKLLSF